MNKNILVIGGTYFAGRVFSLLADSEGNGVTVMNRGSFSMAGTGIKQIICDRRDPMALRAAALEPHYDAIVDFCAYEPGDIKSLLDNIPCGCDHYLYVSTPDVTKPSPAVRDENSPVMDVMPTDEVGLYTWKKLGLETELKTEARARGLGHTMIRPAFIFGPFNYAPREPWYIERIVKGEAIPHPVDATGRFNMVYVKDLARAILTCVYDGRSRDNTYVVSAPEVLDYNTFVAYLKAVSSVDFTLEPVTVADVMARNIPLPFPLTEAENELFDGSRITRELGFTYTGFMENMKKTFEFFYETNKR